MLSVAAIAELISHIFRKSIWPCGGPFSESIEMEQETLFDDLCQFLPDSLDFIDFHKMIDLQGQPVDLMLSKC